MSMLRVCTLTCSQSGVLGYRARSFCPRENKKGDQALLVALWRNLDFDFFYRRRRRLIRPSAPNPAVSMIPEDGSGMAVAVT